MRYKCRIQQHYGFHNHTKFGAKMDKFHIQCTKRKKNKGRKKVA